MVVCLLLVLSCYQCQSPAAATTRANDCDRNKHHGVLGSTAPVFPSMDVCVGVAASFVQHQQAPQAPPQTTETDKLTGPLSAIHPSSPYQFVPHQCRNCGRTEAATQQLCPHCHRAYYCNEACRARDHDLHRLLCRLRNDQLSADRLQALITHPNLYEQQRHAVFQLVLFHNVSPLPLGCRLFREVVVHDDAATLRFLLHAGFAHCLSATDASHAYSSLDIEICRELQTWSPVHTPPPVSFRFSDKPSENDIPAHRFHQHATPKASGSCSTR